MTVDWRKLARSAYEAWRDDRVDLPNVMAELGAALREAPDCEASHPTRTHAVCSLPASHVREGKNHAWTKTADCAHEHTKADSHGNRTCLACGLYTFWALPRRQQVTAHTLPSNTNTKDPE